MDDEKTTDRTTNNNDTRFNMNSLISPTTPSSVPSLSSSSNSNSNSNPTIKRSFIKNSKISNAYNKLTQSRPETHTKKQQKQHLPFNNELILSNLIRCQIEYLFSDYHLTNDTYLLARMQDTPMHWLSIDEICHNQKIRTLTSSRDRVLQALKSSQYLQLSPECDRVRRPDFILPTLKPNRDLRRTVFLYGIPRNKSESDLRAILSQYGHIKRIHSEALESIDLEAPNREVSQLIMRKKYLFPPRYGGGSDHGGSDTESIASMSSIGSKLSSD